MVGESIKVIDNVQYYINITFASSTGTKKGTNTINNITTFGETLYFNIREYKEYNNYNWREDAENGEMLCGEMGQEVEGYNGDKLNNIKVKNGYIYVFDAENNLKYCFELKDGEYQEFEIANGLCSFNTPRGEKAEYATIKSFITDNPEDEHHECKFVFSKVKLSAERLRGDDASGIPKLDPRWFYRQVPMLKYEYLGLQGELKPGVMLLRDYRNDTEMPTLATYHLFSESFGNKEGVSIYYPDPLKELTRRAKIFQKRFEDKENWENTKSRVQQLFLHTTISELIKNDSSLQRYADKERMDLWQKTYKEDLVQHTQKVHNAAQSLINWFKSHILHHTLLNYLSSDDKNDWCVALEVYNNALTYLKDCQLGRSFLLNQVRLKDSFVNQILGYSSLEENTSASSIGQMVFRQAYLNQDKETAIAIVIRKTQQSIFVLTNSFIPAYIAYNEVRAKKMIKKFTLLSTGGKVKLNMTSVTPLQSIDKKVSIFDIEELGKFNKKLSAIDVKIKKGLNSKVVFTTVSLVEAFNVYYSLKVLLDDTDKENKMRKAAIFFGSLIDFTSNVASNRRAQGWILKAAANNKLITSGVKGVLKAVPVLNVISGAVDMFSGMDSAFEAYQDGEMGLAAGYSLNAVGGAICMVGGFMVLEAGQATVASGGTLAVAGGVTAAIGTGVYFIGSAVAYYYDNRDTKEWIEESIFGDDIRHLKENFSNIF